MLRTACKLWLASLLVIADVNAIEPSEPSSKTSGDAVEQAVTNQGTETVDQQTEVSGGSVQSTSGYPQEATRPNALFPAWSLRSTLDIDPRIGPNAGLRVPMAYYPIPGGPLLYPNYSPAQPDFFGGQPTTPWSVRQSLALLEIDDDHVSSKFQEFRDVRNGVTGGVEGHYRSGNTIFNIVGRQLGRSDQDVIADGGVAGKYQWIFTYDETPHNFAFDAKSLWAGIGTGTLTLPDAMQADLQSSTSLQVLSAKMLGYIDGGGQSIDLSLLRQNIGAEVTLIASHPFSLKASLSNESRDGVRPWSASFGFQNFVEIPWPVSYDTREFRLSGEYARPESRLYANASYRFSDFVDNIQTLTFDNPDRIVDAPGALNCSFNCGPATGRMAMYPSNQYHEVSGIVVMKKLPFNSAFNAYVSAGFMRQDEPLLPFSTNSADPRMRSPVNPSFDATDPSGLPRQTADSAMTTKTVSMRWTSDLSKNTRLVGQYRFFGLDNNQEPFTMFEFVREDEDIRRPETVGGTYKTVLAQYAKHTASVEGTYMFTPEARATVAYTFERNNRDFREVARMTDHKVKLQFDSQLFGWVELKTWYERARRTTSPYEFNQYNIVQGNPSPAGAVMFPWLQKFDEAPYDRDEAQAMATVAFTDSMSVSAHVQVAATNFNVAPLGPLSMTTNNVTLQTNEAYQFGVRWDRHYSYGVDFSYVPSQRFNFFADVGYERYRYEQMSRQWTVNGISDPYRRQRTLESNSNWIAEVSDKYYSAGLGIDASLIPDKLKLTVQWVYAKSDGRHDYSSPVGTAAVDDVNAFVPQPFVDVDDTSTYSINPELEYKYSERVSLAAGFQREQWNVDDYNYKGFTYAPVYAAGVGMLMGGLLPRPYSANIAYVRVKMGF